MKKPVDELFGVQHSRKFISNLHGLFTGNCVFIGLQYKAKVRVNEIWAYLKSLSFRFCFFFRALLLIVFDENCSADK